MGLLKHFRSKSRLKSSDNEPLSPTRHGGFYTSPANPPQQQYHGRDQTQRLPNQVLERIFSYVCPHTLDFTYETSERSQIGDGCMLCDLRDLAHCAGVCRKWYSLAQGALYGSIRIDAVHYCALEEELEERRKKAGGRHFRGRSHTVEPGEVPSVRLSLLARTVREHEHLGSSVLVLKLPYMTRETANGDLARCVSALPNLRYVDLPDGFFTGDPSCLALRHELQARCPDIRKMSYRAGSEEALHLLVHRHWQSIEILELNGLSIEAATLRIVLASLPTLHELILVDLPWLDDSIFGPSPQIPEFPPLHSLKLENAPSLTVRGLCEWLSAPHIREVLSSLTLQHTGVTVQDLHQVTWKASSLQHLSITEVVTRSLALASAQIPPLTSISLRTLHFEITSSEEVHGLQKPAESYYAYLASSLHQNTLPGLSSLYVRDPHFPELLILPPVVQPFASGSTGNGSLHSKASNLSSVGVGPSSLGTGSPVPDGKASPRNATRGAGFNQTLEVFSKGLDELEWVFTAICPPPSSTDGHGRSYSSSGGRPFSAYSASRGLGPQWANGGFGGEARKSVVVGNGFGGFLAVPQEEVPMPMTAEGVVDGVGGTRWGSVGSVGTDASAGRKGSLMGLKPPPSLSSLASGGSGGGGPAGDRRSRHDLWR